MQVYRIVQASLFYDNILQLALLLDFNQRLFDQIVEKRLYLLLRFTLPLLVRCKTTLTSKLEIVGSMEQVQRINVLNLGGDNLRNHSFIIRGYILSPDLIRTN